MISEANWGGTTDPPLLIIGNRETSSWSLRAWLAFRRSGLPFDVREIDLRADDARELLDAWTPHGKAPALLIGDFVVGDSLAICEFVADYAPHLWPEDPLERAMARSLCAEVHSGFLHLRRHMPLDLTQRFPFPGHTLKGVARDLHVVTRLWRECRAEFAPRGPFLFGEFCLADVFFTPIALRFLGYNAPLDPVSAEYAEILADLPELHEWIDRSPGGIEMRRVRPPAPGERATIVTAPGPIREYAEPAADHADREDDERPPEPEREQPVFAADPSDAWLGERGPPNPVERVTRRLAPQSEEPRRSSGPHHPVRPQEEAADSGLRAISREPRPAARAEIGSDPRAADEAREIATVEPRRRAEAQLREERSPSEPEEPTPPDPVERRDPRGEISVRPAARLMPEARRIAGPRLDVSEEKGDRLRPRPSGNVDPPIKPIGAGARRRR